MTGDRRRVTDRLDELLRAKIRDVPDFPTPGVLFKDITPLLADSALFSLVVEALAAPFRNSDVTHVVGVESRGFIFGAPVALLLGVAFVPARKPGKLPARALSESYALEYGTAELQIHEDAFATTPAGGVTAARASNGQRIPRVLIVDDLLATGGTARAAVNLVKRLGAEPVGVSAVVDLAFLPWRSALAGTQVETLVSFS